MIRVSNAGPVIPERDLERVFERLYRGEYARSSPGSGLGLTIARRIAELHGGSVTLRSSAGQGTVVEMRLADRSAQHLPAAGAIGDTDPMAAAAPGPDPDRKDALPWLLVAGALSLFVVLYLALFDVLGVWTSSALCRAAHSRGDVLGAARRPHRRAALVSL